MDKFIRLKTALYGGYDKDDVQNCLKAKDGQIALLEKELAAAKALLTDEGKAGQLSEATLQPVLKENESLRQQISELEQQCLASESRADEEKNRADKLAAEKEKLSAHLLEAKERLAASENDDEDEAVERVLEIAQEQLDEMLESAEAESMQLHTAAKAAAERIIREAEARAKQMESARPAEMPAKGSQQPQNGSEPNREMIEAARQVELSTINDLQKLTLQVRKIKDCLEAFTATGIAQIQQTNSLIANAEKLVAKGKIPMPWNTERPAENRTNAQTPVPSLASAPQKRSPAEQPAAAAPVPTASGEGPSLASIVAMAAQLSASTESEQAEKTESNMNLDDIAKLAATLDYPPEATDMNQKMDLEELANIAESL